MTSIAWRNGVLAVDSCVSNFDDGNYTHRTTMNKMKTTQIGGLFFAIASRGDVTAGEDTDEAIFGQLRVLYGKKRSQRSLIDLLNDSRPLHRRREAINDADYEAILVRFDPNAGTATPYYVTESGRVRLITEQFLAIGCDSYGLYTALEVGASADDAVAAASKHGPYTGFPVRYAWLEPYDGKFEVSVRES